MSETPVEVVNQLNLIRREYGQFVATQNIYVGTCLAHTPGQAVPASNVERYGWLELGLVAAVPQPQPGDDFPGDVVVVPPADQQQ